MEWGLVTAADGFAFAMIAVIGCGFGVLVVLFLSMRRHAGRRDDHVDDLLREVALLEKSASNSESPTPQQPWERQADWWKQGGS